MLSKFFLALGAAQMVFAQRPFFIKTAQGKRAKIGERSFVMSDSSLTNEEGNYVAITPAMLQGGYWGWFQEAFARWGGGHINKAYNSEYICLDNYWLIHNFHKDITSTKDSEVAKVQASGNKNHFCIAGSCYGSNTDSFRELPQFSYSEVKCENQKLYVKENIHKILKTGLTNVDPVTYTKEANNWLFWEVKPDGDHGQNPDLTTQPPTKAPVVTRAPVTPGESEQDRLNRILLEQCKANTLTQRARGDELRKIIRENEAAAKIRRDRILEQERIIAEQKVKIAKQEIDVGVNAQIIRDLLRQIAEQKIKNQELLNKINNLKIKIAENGNDENKIKELEAELKELLEEVEKLKALHKACEDKCQEYNECIGN